jgi:hypothetical protein
MPHRDLKDIIVSIIVRHYCRLVQVIAIASNALEDFKNDAKKMVVALVDMEQRAIVPPQHFIRLL